MDEETFTKALGYLLMETGSLPDDENDTDYVVNSTSTFEKAGVLTMNNGLIVRLSDGSEFQVTIVQSRESKQPRNTEEG